MRPPQIRPNAGDEAAYRKRLIKLIESMHNSARYWITAEYRGNETRIVGDEAPAKTIARVMEQKARYWQKIFNSEARSMSGWFIGKASKTAARQLNAQLRAKKLPTVKFDPSRATNDLQQALIQENVALIKSIPSEYFGKIEKMVTRSVSSGGDLKQLTDDLEHEFGVTRKRAEFIARDQNNKATEQIANQTCRDVGFVWGRWHHSHGGKVPRQSHLRVDEKVYELEKGMFIDGEWIIPGQMINCRCFFSPLIPGYDYPIDGKPEDGKSTYSDAYRRGQK
jgi:uncharacterized protein with gpF-like domain